MRTSVFGAFQAYLECKPDHTIEAKPVAVKLPLCPRFEKIEQQISALLGYKCTKVSLKMDSLRPKLREHYSFFGCLYLRVHFMFQNIINQLTKTYEITSVL